MTSFVPASNNPARTENTAQKIAEGFLFTDGPAEDANGNLYFSDKFFRED